MGESMAAANGYRHKRQSPVAVLELGTSKISCLIAKAISAPPGLEVLGFGRHESRGIKGGAVVHMDSAEAAIRAAVDHAERMAGFAIEEVYVPVACGRLKSDSFSASVAIRDDAIAASDIDRVLSAGHDYAARDGRKVLHTLPIGYRLDDASGISDPRGMIGDRLAIDIHAMTADEAPLRNLSLCVERCHLSIVGLVAAPYASGLATIVSDEARLGVTCVDMGAGTTTFAVFAEGHCLHADAFAIGGGHVTLDLARALCTPLEEAERIKTLHGSAFATSSDEARLVTYPMIGEDGPAHTNKVSKAQIAEIARPRAEEILTLVRDRLAASGLGAVAGQRVVLTGGASQLTGLVELAGRLLGKSVRLGRPRPLPGLADANAGPALAATVGLAMHSDSATAAIRTPSPARMLATGTGYMARVGQWLRESF